MKVLCAAVGLLLMSSGLGYSQVAVPQRILVGNVELHYTEQGRGEPIIMLHGGQGDYRSWQQHMNVLSSTYRVISYSRRYHYPNENPARSDYSPLIDADDLSGLITQLGLGPVHLVGTSIGAFTALALALENPGMVRTLVLAEPPVLAWAANSPEGAPLYRDFMARTHEQAAPAFAVGNDEAALRAFIDAFDGTGTFSSLPEERRRSIMQNVGYFRAITLSVNPYPNLSKELVARLDKPALIIRGELTHELDKFVSDELLRVLPRARLVAIPGAGHGSPRTHPALFLAAVTEFLSANQN